MSLNRNWIKWITASIFKYFDDRKETLLLHVDEIERKTDKNYVQLQVNGPVFTESTQNEWVAVVDINCTVSTIKDSMDLYNHEKASGLIASLMTANICVYKYGDGGDLLGTLIRQTGVETLKFGQLDPEIQVLESSIQATYKIDL